MHLLRRNIGCHLPPDVSAARYTVPLLSLYFRFPQSSRQQEDIGQKNGSFWWSYTEVLGSIFWQLVTVVQALTLHQCQTGLTITLPGCLQTLSVAKSKLQNRRHRTIPPRTLCLLLALFTPRPGSTTCQKPAQVSVLFQARFARALL